MQLKLHHMFPTINPVTPPVAAASIVFLEVFVFRVLVLYFVQWAHLMELSNLDSKRQDQNDCIYMY